MSKWIRLLVSCSFLALSACTGPVTMITGSSTGRLAQSAPRASSKRIEDIAPRVRERLIPFFSRAGIEYPPAKISIIALKQEKRLELCASNASGAPRYIKSFRILAASGGIGPKLREGDGQVPEGVYRIDYLKLNSTYHVAMRVSYPNAFDRQHATLEGRRGLGGDIMIHGDAVSAGCLAMGDLVAENLFVLAADVGVDNIEVILSPLDLRKQPAPPAELQDQPAWVPELYETIRAEMQDLQHL